MEKKSSIKTYKFFTALFAFACILFITNNSTASATKLSQEEKEQLHQQYIEILNEVKSTVTWGDGLVDIEVSPIEDFEEEAWVSLEVFKQRAIETTTSSVVELPFNYLEDEGWGSEDIFYHQAIENTQANTVAALSNTITPFSTTSASRKVRVRHGSTPVDIAVSATFTTQLSGGRQVFASYSNLRTTASEGNFMRTGVNARITGLGSTYAFTIGGGLNYLGFTTHHTLNTNFICLPTGVVL
ncbi:MULTISPECIES: hypothetical protein [unclassified Lysinibacillus]|uniref:hypothetical protein n=1 Tax=unclassified Lysinibacillus TaxID=2636778 RepID=UPI00382CD8D8